MTYRELLSGLSKLSDEQLDQDVLVLSNYNTDINLGENGEIEDAITFNVAEHDMYKYPLTSGPCGMCWDGESYRPAFEVEDEDLIAPDFVKCYDAGTPYFSIHTI